MAAALIAAPCGFAKKHVPRLVAKHVEDDLHRLHARVLEGLEGFVDFLDAHAVMLKFAYPLQIIEDCEHLGNVVHRRRRTVEL